MVPLTRSGINMNVSQYLHNVSINTAELSIEGDNQQFITDFFCLDCHLLLTSNDVKK